MPAAPRDLAAAFLERFGADTRAVDDRRVELLEHALARHIEAARGAWPGVEVEPRAFVRHLSQKAGDEPNEAIEAIDRLHVGDLYLAFACAAQHPRALAAFERFVAEVPSYLAKLRAEPALVSEVQQELRHKLFVADGKRVAAITRYGGRGPLGAWVRVATVRTAASLRRGRRHVPLDEGLARAGVASSDPELEYLERRYGEALQGALRDELRALEAQGRVLLRLHYVERVSTHALGGMYGVDHSTIVRRLTRLRERILEGVRARARERLALSASRVDSLLMMLQSRLDVTLSQLLDRPET